MHYTFMTQTTIHADSGFGDGKHGSQANLSANGIILYVY